MTRGLFPGGSHEVPPLQSKQLFGLYLPQPHSGQVLLQEAVADPTLLFLAAFAIQS
jgi:hypothetical protein